jgi:glycosyltransferase involved in cell wall biosynthesis
MRIAIDARELIGTPTGVGRYLRNILAAWNELPGAAAHQYVFCTPFGFHDHTLPNLDKTFRVGRGRGTMFEQTGLPLMTNDADVLFAPGYSGPLFSRVPMVVTIHDVSFAAHPEWFSWREGLRRRVVTRLSARRAARIITVSDFSKREIVRHLGVDGAKVEVIYSGATTLAPTPQEPGGRREGDPDPGALVLFVGSLFNRRHVPELIDGFSRLAQRHPGARLEIVGDNRTMPHLDIDRLIAQSPARGRIRARSYVADPELATLYASASAFAFLSDYEGFAMTPLEALGAGVPVVLLDTEVAREIYGPAARYVERPDPADIADALETILFNQAERTRLLAAAALTLERYSWRDCAHRTLQVLLSCARS